MLSKLSDTIFRIYRIIGRLLIKYSSDPRPSSYPYITGDGIRNNANHIYDNLKTFDPKDVKDNDVIFVGDSSINQFLADLHPKIIVPYILVTHNGDAVVNDEMVARAGNKVLKWYGINVVTSSPKVIPLPLGIENKHYYVLGIPSIFDAVIKNPPTKKNRIFYGFTVSTNKEERAPALAALMKHPLAETITRWLNFKQYLPLLATYKFVASPPGSCVEGHRTWDALYIGSVPIVKSSITTEYFKKIGAPIHVVKNWEELDALDEVKLEELFTSIKANGDRSVLYIDYWIDKIKNAKD